MSGGGAAVAAGGVLTGRDVALIGNLAASDGGGLLALGTTQIANADIGGNAAYTGGGVYSVGGNLTLSNATIHDNVASLWGGGIRGHDGVIDISSSTITGNAATGGSAYEPASGGGIMMTSSAAGLTITNTIIAGNAATAGADMTTGDTPTGLRGVILGEAAQQWYGGALALPTDQALVLTDMGLTTADVFGAVTGAGGGVAAANGGFGDTVALAAAIANPATGGAVARPGVALDPGDLDADGVTDEAIPFDARGVARPSLGADIGAYEAPTLETPSLLVTTMADIVNDSDGLTSLREAVAYASLGTEGRTVQFATGGVATLDHGALALDGILTIYGDVNGDGAADVTIDAQGLSRVAVVGSVGVELTAVDLTGGLSAGNGGAIEVLDGAYLRTVRVSVSGSVAGGDGGAIHVATGGHMTAYDTVVSDNRASGSGGGIAVGVGAEFRASGLDVAGNYAEFGGGIHFDHAAGLIQNATVHGNQAHWGGGGIALVSSGVTVDATTLTGNYANGQIFGGGEGNGSGNPGYGGGLLITGVAETEPSITNTLIVGNGVGGVVDAGGLAGIVPAKGADMSLGGGAAPVFSGVLVGEDVGAAVTGLLIDGNNYDLFWVTALSSFGLGSADVFAQVSGVAGVVADNGGPIRTAALLASPLNLAVDGAIAASLDPLNVDGDGATATLPVDARGEARDAAQDIGSYELPPSDAPSLVVTSTGDVTDAFDGVTTLREAIAWVESGALTGVITFAHGAGEAFETRGTYVTLGGSELLVSGEVSIDGDLGGDRPGVQIYAALLSRAVRVADGGALTLMNTSLEGGVAQGDGGGALVQTGGALTLDGVNITSNRTEGGDGGGVFVEAGATLVGRDLFVGYNGAASLSAYEHTFGGGIGAMGAVSLVNATLTRNAAENGGGIGVFGGAATLVNVTVVENYGYVGGAGVSVAGGGSAIIDHSTITANETIAGDGGAGGGIAAVASDVTLTNSIVVGNVDSEAGVASDVAVDGGVLTAGRDTLFGVAATDLAGAPAAGIGARVLAAEGLTGADIFAAAGPLGEGAVTYEAFNDRGASIVALAAVAGNVALGSAISAPDMLDADGDGDVAEALPVDVRGVARAAIGGDLGAYEVTTTFDGAPSLLVTTTSDAINDSDGETSLREALGYLQSGALSGAITFASGAGEAFENGAAITLYGGELALSGVIAIDGDVNGDGVADVTLDAGGASRAVDVAAGADVRLSHLIVTGGDAGAENGGGIRLAGGAALDLDGVTVAGSFAAQGGGIFADYGAVLTARDLVLTGNGAGGIGGGGLASKGGDVTIVNAEISGNTSESNGGGIVAYYFGDIRLVNVTLHGNAAEYGGGMMLTQSTATLDHVTVAGNSAAGAGGMSVSGDLAITNSVIADNEVTGAYPANPDLWVDSYSGDVTGASGVLLGSAAYHDDLYTAFAAPGMAAVDPASLFAAYDDAGVPVLADNGGPVKTVALSPEAGNPALDVALPVFGAGIDADGDGSPDPILSVDARGVARPWISDIGAYEAPGVLAKSLVVTTAADVMSDFDGETSLREAIGWVQDGSLTGTITFASGAGGAFAGGGTIVLNGTELLITGAVAIDGDIGGDGTADVTIDAGGLSRVINVAGGAADLTGLAITGGHVGTGSHGGGILVDGAGALTLSAVRIAGNSAGVAGDFDSLGGGVAVFGGSSLTARDVAFNRNTASLGGGGIYLEGEASLVNAEIAGNLATDVYGGGIWAGLGALSMTNATVHGNVAGLEGGGVFSSAATVSIDHSTITANEALTYHGGGVVAYQGSLSVTNSIIAGNTGALADGNDLLLGAPDNGMAVSLDAVLLGEAAHHTSQFTPFAPSPAAGTMVMADLGVTLSDVFAAFDGSGAPVLAANGGFARTVALEGVVGNPALAASSPALDPLDADGDGDVAEGLPVDARGVARGALSDLGAYEAPALDGDLRYVTTTLDVVNDSDGLVSLREALSYANAESGPADVRFDSASLGGGTVFTLTGGALEVTGDVTFHGDIDGNGAGDVVIDANAASRALAVSDGGRATLNDMTLTGGYAATGFGGAILVDGGASLRIDRSFVTDSAAAAGGGGIFVDIGGALVGANSVITGNAASAGNGGGLLSRGDVTLQGVEIGGNQAISGGGAMVDGGVTRLLNATIHGNIAASFGGGVASLGAGGVTLTNATVTGNTAKAFAGGGVLLGGVGAPSLIENSIVAGNAGPRGADVALMGGDWGVQNTLFGTAALTDGRAGHDAAASVVPVLADMGVGLDKVFETLDAAGLGGLATDMGGIGKTVALAATFSNPAIDAGLDLIDTDALGAPRAVAFIDPFGVDAADLGAVEAVRQALPGLVGLLATGAPVVGDLGAGAADLSGAAADFDGAALANLSADDALLFAGATSAAQFGYDGTFLTYDSDLDGVAEATTWLSLAPNSPPLTIEFDAVAGGVAISASAPVPLGNAIGEVVQITVGTDWQTINFANTYNNAVVFALAPSLNEVESAATRFRNIDATGGEIKLQETRLKINPETGLPEANTSGHVNETVTLLVLEAGKHTLEDGTVIRVSELFTSKLYVKGFESIGFSSGMTTTPSIFSQVQTYNGSDFIISRQRNPTTSGFDLTMQEEQADNLNHATETVGWLAIEHGSGSWSTMDWQAGSSAQNVNGKLTNVSFSAAFDEAPLVVASLASYNGTDTSSPRVGSVGTSGFTAMALEDQSFDLETNHGYEIVDWLAFSNAGIIYDGSVPAPVALNAPLALSMSALSVAEPEVAAPSLVAQTGKASVGSDAVTVSFGATFVNPVVIATLTSAYDVGAAIARVSNVTATGFDVAVQETGDQDGVHGAEDVSWIVVEAGTWVLADGTMIQAGLTDLGLSTKQGFASIDFEAGFDADRAVLSQTQTANDAAFVKTRMDGVDGTGFAVALEEDEASHWGAHGSETVGWIAVDAGLAMGADGFAFEAGTLRARDGAVSQGFDADLADAGVVAGIASFAGPDTAAARLGALTETGFDAWVEEDLSFNPETSHRAEDISWLAFDGASQIWGDALA
jgi:predicted outer membrane repeat protein